MQAVILSAGEGLRLRPFTTSKPKVMIKVANKPILEYVINSLAENNIREIMIVVGYKKESVMSYFGNGSEFNVKINYAVQEKPLGTANALSKAKIFVKDDFLVLSGDNIIESNAITELIKSGANSMLLTESEIPSKYGVVILEKGKVKNIFEKPQEQISNLISTGVFLFSKKIFKYVEKMEKQGKHDITSSIQEMLCFDEIKGIEVKNAWEDAVYPWDLLTLNFLALNKMKVFLNGTIEKNVFMKGNVAIGERSIIRGGTYILGNVIIGKGCEIGPNAVIFPSTSIGDNCKIDSFTEVKNSIIKSNVNIGSFSTISNSIIGEGTTIKSHFIAEGKKAEVKVHEYHEVENIGAIIGDDCFIDSNVIVDSGVMISANCRIEGNKRISKNVERNAIVV